MGNLCCRLGPAVTSIVTRTGLRLWTAQAAATTSSNKVLIIIVSPRRGLASTSSLPRLCYLLVSLACHFPPPIGKSIGASEPFTAKYLWPCERLLGLPIYWARTLHDRDEGTECSLRIASTNETGDTGTPTHWQTPHCPAQPQLVDRRRLPFPSPLQEGRSSTDIDRH